jgi:hypothetical protein
LVSFEYSMNDKIETYTTLLELVDLDTKDHKLKEMATLLLHAMNDWPTFNQYKIPDFIQELKDYYGSPLTVEQIAAKKFNGQNAWQLEAGNSIAELIEVSTSLYDESDLDTIVKNILEHYEQR